MEILLNSKRFGQVVLIIDDIDADLLKKCGASIHKSSTSLYARCTRGIYNGKMLHNVLMNPKKGQQVDHINHNTLDNRRQNLRLCSVKQNCMNRRKRKNCTSKFKGVYKKVEVVKNKEYVYYQARLTVNGKDTSIGYFKSEIDAAKAYDAVCKKEHGEFAV